MSYRPIGRRPIFDRAHLHAYGDFVENFGRRPAYIQKPLRFVLFWRPVFPTETRRLTISNQRHSF